MGVTLKSKNYSLDFGYGGFNSIRTKVAELAADDIGEHYRHLSDVPFFEKDRKPFFEEYDKKPPPYLKRITEKWMQYCILSMRRTVETKCLLKSARRFMRL